MNFISHGIANPPPQNFELIGAFVGYRNQPFPPGGLLSSVIIAPVSDPNLDVTDELEKDLESTRGKLSFFFFALHDRLLGFSAGVES